MESMDARRGRLGGHSEQEELEEVAKPETEPPAQERVSAESQGGLETVDGRTRRVVLTAEGEGEVGGVAAVCYRPLKCQLNAAGEPPARQDFEPPWPDYLRLEWIKTRLFLAVPFICRFRFKKISRYLPRN
jgi:hypothetical protein